MTARVEITHNTASPALRRALGLLQGEGRELMLEQIGEYLMRGTRERAEQQVDPDGHRWFAIRVCEDLHIQCKSSVASPVQARTGSRESITCVIDSRSAIHGRPESLKNSQTLSPAYKRWKNKKRPGEPILKFDFHMLGDQLSYQIESDGHGLLMGRIGASGTARSQDLRSGCGRKESTRARHPDKFDWADSQG